MGRWDDLSLEQQQDVLDAALSAANKVAGGASWQELERKLALVLEMMG